MNNAVNAGMVVALLVFATIKHKRNQRNDSNKNIKALSQVHKPVLLGIHRQINKFVVVLSQGH
jgi:hypothetical protein